MSLQTWFLVENERVMLVTKPHWLAVYLFVHTMAVNGNGNWLVTNILQNIVFCVVNESEPEGE